MLLFVFLFLQLVCIFLFFVSPGDDVLRWLLSLSVPLCLLSSLIFFSERFPGLIWFGSVYLVITAGFVADRLLIIM